MADSNNGNATQNQGAPASGQAPEMQELAEYKQFFEGVSPLLTKLNENPDLVKAILEDKLTTDYAKAALDGKLSVAQEAATQVAAEIKEAVESNTSISKEDLAKIIDEKVAAAKSEILEKGDMEKFEQYTSDFISTRPDWDKYAGDVAKWLDSHDVTDVAVAYYAVKGELSEKEAKDKAAEDAAEAAKSVIMSAAYGGSPSSAIIEDKNVIDSLIASHSNPNRL